MRQLTMVAALLVASIAGAKPWQGIELGSSEREEVTKKFGEPTKVIQSNGKDVLVYVGKEAIKARIQDCCKEACRRWVTQKSRTLSPNGAAVPAIRWTATMPRVRAV